MKKWTPVEVKWQDAHGDDRGWEVLAEDQHRPCPIRTVGMLYNENKQGVTIVLSRMSHTDLISAFIFIPTPRIISLRALS